MSKKRSVIGRIVMLAALMSLSVPFAAAGTSSLARGLAAFRSGHFQKALAPLEKAAGKDGRRSARADLALARIYGVGFTYGMAQAVGDDSVRRNRKASFRWLSRAAKLGSPKARYLVATAYLFGGGVRRGRKRGLRELEKAARAGSQFAMARIIAGYAPQGPFAKGDKGCKKVRFWLGKVPKRIDDPVLPDLAGDFYQRGICVPRSHAKAIAMYRQAAVHGVPAAIGRMDTYWHVRLRKTHAAKARRKAAYWDRRSALVGNRVGEWRMLNRYRRKAQSGSLQARYDLASAAAMGLGEKNNPVEAYARFSELASGKDKVAAEARRQARLIRPFVQAQKIEWPQLVKRIESRCGCKLALKYKTALYGLVKLDKKAAGADSHAKMQLASAFLRLAAMVTSDSHGNNAVKLFDVFRNRATRLALNAGLKGDRTAVRLMANYLRVSQRVYPNGAMMPSDILWQKKAAALHDARSESYLGELYFRGDGVSADKRKATALFASALGDARRGDAIAYKPFYRMGVMKLEGQTWLMKMVGRGESRHLGQADALLLASVIASRGERSDALVPTLALNAALSRQAKRRGLAYLRRLLLGHAKGHPGREARLIWKAVKARMTGGTTRSRIRLGNGFTIAEMPDHMIGMVKLMEPGENFPWKPFYGEAAEKKRLLDGNVLAAAAVDQRYVRRLERDEGKGDRSAAISDARQRLKWLVRGAKAGNARSVTMYGLALMRGMKLGQTAILEKNCKKGMKWLARGVAGGRASASQMAALGQAYMKGDCGTDKPGKALKWLERAAVAGSARAADALGRYYLGKAAMAGHGIAEPNPARAREWMTQAAMDAPASPNALNWLVKQAIRHNRRC